MKMKNFALLAVLILCVCVCGAALAADFTPLTHLSGLDLSSLAAVATAPVMTPIAKGIDREMKRKNGGAADDTDVGKELKRISDQVLEFCEKNKDKIENADKLSAKAKEMVDELLGKQGELRERLQDVEQKLAKAGEGGGDVQAVDAGMQFEKYLDENPELRASFANIKQGQMLNVPIDRKAITNSGTTGAALNYPAQTVSGIVAPLQRRLTIRDLLAGGRTDAAAIFYPRETGFTNSSAVVSEGSLKPESDLTFDPQTEAVVTIAHWLRISKQMAADVPALVSYINNRLTYGLKLVEENQLLNGSGTGGNIEGIYTAATAYANTTSLANETDLDKIRLAILQAELAFAEVNGIVLNPTNWALMELTKDNTGQYVFARPQESAQPRLWGRTVVATPAMTTGRFLVGDFAQHAQIFDRADASVAISAEDRDNFVRNMLTILVEERLALAIYRPQAFIKGRLESSTGPGL